MKNGLFTLDLGSVADATLTAVVAAVLAGFVGLVATTGFNVFTADWVMLGKGMINIGFIAGVLSLGQSLLTTYSGSFLGVTPPYSL